MARVLRALPSVAAAVLVTGVLAAVVIAAPSSEPRERDARGAGPLALLRDRPTELQPELSEFDSAVARPTPRPRARTLEPIERLPRYDRRRPSRAVGLPWDGRLVNGRRLPAEGVGYFTFDSALRVSPSRGWRRWATAETVARTLAVLDGFAAANPGAPRLGVGDLSRPRGGVFDRRFGGLGHASHQNGLDVDVYYPRRDRSEVPPGRPSDVDRRLSQDLVDRFVAAGAELVFVGPSLRLRGPRRVVKPLVHHDDHVHVRWPAQRP
jgi:hypothetical protein